jgi:AAA+ lid domain
MCTAAQGLLMASPATHSDPGTLARLWLHEALHVYGDRLVCDQDRSVLLRTLTDAAIKAGLDCAHAAEATQHQLSIWVDFLRPDINPHPCRPYEEATDISHVAKLLQEAQEDYNATPGHASHHLSLGGSLSCC